MFKTLAEILRQKELRSKILVTMGLLAVFRMGTFIPIPLLDYHKFTAWFKSLATEGGLGNILNMVTMMTAGSMSRGTVFSL
jgi:preprotein translocase subunit SecY